MLEIALSLEGSILVHPGKIYRLVYLVLPGKSSMLAVLQSDILGKKEVYFLSISFSFRHMRTLSLQKT